MKQLSFVVLAASIVLAACCKSETEEPEQAAAPQPATAAPGPESFTWTDAPTLESIPSKPAQGEANGKPMKIETVVFEPSNDAWRLILSDKRFDSPTAIMMGGQSVNISLTEEPAAGRTMTRKAEYGGGYFQINKVDNPSETTSWNGTNSWVIQITKWEVKPYDPAGEMFQEAGKASGRVVVVYQAGADFKNSWVAGTFEDATVRYMGKPSWVKG